MWEKDYYKRFLSEDQLEEVQKVIEDDRDNIYKSSDSKIQSTLNRIYETVIIETAIRFKDREYFSNEKFEDFIRDAGYDVPKLDKEAVTNDLSIPTTNLFHDPEWPEIEFDAFDQQTMDLQNRKGGIWQWTYYKERKEGTWYELYVKERSEYVEDGEDLGKPLTENEEKMSLLLHKLYLGVGFGNFIGHGQINVWVSSKEELATFDRFLELFESCYVNPNTLEYDEEYFQSKIKSLESIISDRGLDKAFEELKSADKIGGVKIDSWDADNLREIFGFNDTDEKEASAPLKDRAAVKKTVLEIVSKQIGRPLSPEEPRRFSGQERHEITYYIVVDAPEGGLPSDEYEALKSELVAKHGEDISLNLKDMKEINSALQKINATGLIDAFWASAWGKNINEIVDDIMGDGD